VLGDREFAARPANVMAVGIEIARKIGWAKLPSVRFEQLPVGILKLRPRQLERLIDPAWQIEELPILVVLAPGVCLAPERHVVPVLPPIADGRERVATASAAISPEIADDRGSRRLEWKSIRQRHPAIGLAVVSTPGVERTMRLEKLSSFPPVVVQLNF